MGVSVPSLLIESTDSMIDLEVCACKPSNLFKHTKLIFQYKYKKYKEEPGMQHLTKE